LKKFNGLAFKNGRFYSKELTRAKLENEQVVIGKGKDEFNAFYRKNRASMFRGEEGVGFPLLYGGDIVLQGSLL